jgi:hypothetical protein
MSDDISLRFKDGSRLSRHKRPGPWSSFARVKPRDVALDRAQTAESRLAPLEQQLRAPNAASLDMTEIDAVADMDREE